MTTDRDLLYSLTRDGAPEVEIRGEIIVTHGEGESYATRELRQAFPARSLLKPFQFLAGDIPAERWRGVARYAACLGSVHATEAQIAALREWYRDAEWQPLRNALSLPATWPSDETARVLVKQNGAAKEMLFNPCFSKHMGILESCRMHRWDLASYASAEHPFHKRLTESLSYLTGADLAGVPVVTDGCQLPTPILEMSQMAELYRRLAAASEETPLGGVKAQMWAQTEWIGGPEATDTRLMQANPGKLVAKEGADGLLAVGICPTSRFPRGLGILVKIHAGYLPARAALALNPILKALDLTPTHQAPKGHEVEFHYVPFAQPAIAWHDITPLVNAQSRLFPEEIRYQRDVSLDTAKGDGITLSSICASVHVGAHADAPNHFSKSDVGIDRVPIAKYAGVCQVIHVRKEKGRGIVPEDLKAVVIRAPRVLFRTDSAADPTVFDRSFVALSAEVVHWLGKQGVVLVGIDTPSIDPAASKELAAHRATLDHGMAILENLTLAGVAPGIYQLVALPLRLEGSDASPVRAALLPLV